MKKRRIIKIVLMSLFIFILINMLAVPIVYGIVFSSPHQYSDDTLGVYSYSKIENNYKREEISYSGRKGNIQGYAYMSNPTDYLVVTVHGIKDNADCLLMEDMYFIDNGYNVFSFDMSGCGKSDGSINGFSQGLIDLDYTLDFLNSDSRFKDTKKLLFGFSAGGYAVASVLALNTQNVYGVVSLSGYNDAENLVANKGFGYAGPLVYLGKPIVTIMEHMMFNEYLTIKATDGINNTTIPVFLGHGINDHTVNYKYSILANYEDSNRVVKYKEDAGHSSLLYSKEAKEYQSLVKIELKKNKNYQVDDLKYSELNQELFSNILDFYDECK